MTTPAGSSDIATLAGITVVERPDVAPNMVYMVQDGHVTHIIDLDKLP